MFEHLSMSLVRREVFCFSDELRTIGFDGTSKDTKGTNKELENSDSINIEKDENCEKVLILNMN